MKKNNFKYQAVMVLMAFMIFSCAGSTETQDDTATETETLGDTETLAEAGEGEDVTYENMFNNIEETEEHDVLSLLRMEEDLSTFAQLVEMSDLDASIEFAGPVTILAPANQAFQEMPREQYEMLTNPENRVMLTRIIKAHILPNKVYMRDFEEDQMIETSEGEEIPVNTAGEQTTLGAPTTVVIGGAQIVKSDVEAENGVIHVVDDVIIPEETSDTTIGTY